jgi:hypothetical protein
MPFISGQIYRCIRTTRCSTLSSITAPRSASVCLWLSERRLKGNDFSPLLLHPSNEMKYEKARWLKGHTTITANTLGLGFQTQPARVAPRLQCHAIHLELELVGELTDTFSWEMQVEDHSFGFSKVLPYLVKSAGGSAAQFAKILEYVYPAQFFWTKGSTVHYQFPALRYEVPLLDAIKIEGLLKQYTEAINRNDIPELKSLRHAVISLLGLSIPPQVSNSASFANLSRLQLYSQLCNVSECTLISVSCPNCNKTTVFRASLWQKPTAQARHCLIPGLAYQYSVRDGVGIIVESEEILGRVRFGPPACGCNPPAAVKLT